MCDVAGKGVWEGDLNLSEGVGLPRLEGKGSRI